MIREVIDLTKNAWVKRHGDLTVFGTWYNDREDGWLPCLVILPTFRPATPCVVMMDLSWIWSEEAGDPAWAADVSSGFAESLGLSPDKKTCIRIAMIIRDHLGDLLTIPPRPADAMQIVADAIVKTQDGKERHAEIMGNV
ncbi:MAG: hypothetical protein GC182_08930 [Rhodopseudomonas sp.]|nr:hypothetical protein [Rhodopseudomonas sp.]